MNSPSRNDPCPCGSGKKYKKCCLAAAQNQPSDPDKPSVHPLNPKNAAPPSERLLHALALHRDGRLDEAEAAYRSLLQENPANSDALHYLGLISFRRGEYADAARLIEQAIKLNGNIPAFHFNLGNTCVQLKQLDPAADAYRKATQLDPGFLMAYLSLGGVLKAQGKLDAAIACYRKIIALKPDHAVAHNNLGLALQAYGKTDEAIRCYRKMLALKPDYADAHVNLGNALLENGRLDKAVEHYRKALALEPGLADAHNNLGLALQKQGALSSAVASYREALALKPDFAEAYSNLLLLYGFNSTLAPRDYLALARGWEQACLSPQERQAARSKAFLRAPLAGRRLKVGYVSGDFRQHAVSCFVEQLFTHHDRARIELFAYSNHSQRDAVTERLQVLTDHWAPVFGTPDGALRDRIEADGIDVLIDLSGHTAHNRMGVFARRAAPVQAHYLGFFASTGLTEMDYWIGDETLTPVETDSHFSEQVWRLPQVWVCYNSKAGAPLPYWRPSQDRAVWVGSFNNLGKLTPATLALWAEVLHALPEAKLLLKAKDLADGGTRRRILNEMASHDIPAARIELLDSSATPGWPSHMACYDRLDIALDPVGGVSGGTTTCDALWMGLPVITLEGDRMATRMTASMLHAIGHPEWISRSEAEYVDKVVALARDVEQRKALCFTQRDRMAASPLCDARGLAREMENAYFEMFRLWQEQQGKRSSP